jgi:hypothetical protein
LRFRRSFIFFSKHIRLLSWPREYFPLLTQHRQATSSETFAVAACVHAGIALALSTFLSAAQMNELGFRARVVSNAAATASDTATDSGAATGSSAASGTATATDSGAATGSDSSAAIATGTDASDPSSASASASVSASADEPIADMLRRKLLDFEYIQKQARKTARVCGR